MKENEEIISKYISFDEIKNNMKEIVCITCGSYGQPKKKTNGSFLLEIGLWCLFFIPGIIYSIWRISTRYKACSVCGSRSIVPADSPIGQKLLTNK